MRSNVTVSILSGVARRAALLTGAAVILSLQLVIAPVASAASGAISQGYKTTSNNVTKGALVSLWSSGSTTVVPANSTTNLTKLVGIAADKPLVELSNGSEADTRVVVSGTTEALVSDINGAVKAGDKITASPVSGIGMKAVSAAEIIGTAQADLSSVSTVDQPVDDKDGKKQTIKVGMVPVAVSVAYYSASSSQGGVSSFVPPFLQSIANTVAGRQVSPLRVLLAATTLLLGFVAVIVILQTSIRNGLISIGRNPLAQGALRKGLADIIIMAVGLLVVTAVVVYVAIVI
jgi:hypothetical protein